MLIFDTVVQTKFGSYFKAFCQPSDPKPTTGVCSGSTIEEFNPTTGKVDIYRFNGSAWEKTVTDGTPAGSLPASATTDAGKVLTVGEDGKAGWAELPPPEVLPPLPEEDGTYLLKLDIIDGEDPILYWEDVEGEPVDDTEPGTEPGAEPGTEPGAEPGTSDVEGT